MKHAGLIPSGGGPGIDEDELEEVLDPIPAMPIARWRGMLDIVGLEVPCYVLHDGHKIIGRTSATELLTGIKGSGGLEKYITVKALEPFINKDLVIERFVPFRLLEVERLEKAVKGLPSDLMIEVRQGFVAALQSSFDPNSKLPKLTDRQIQIALKASAFLSACAKVGLEALIDEATGYQYVRADMYEQRTPFRSNFAHLSPMNFARGKRHSPTSYGRNLGTLLAGRAISIAGQNSGAS